MSLFHCGFLPVSTSNTQTEQPVGTTAAHVPPLEQSGLGSVEYEAMLGANITDPTPTAKRRKLEASTQYLHQ